MAGNNIPERLTNFKVYDENNDVLGLANVTLPEIQAMTDTVSGAGIAGEVDAPVVGHFQSMEMTINWRTIEPAALKITAGKAHTLDIRGSQRYYDAGLSEWKDVPVRVSVKAVPKTLTLGTFEVGSATDTSVVYEVLYLKVFQDNKERVEIDKFNFIARFDGQDLLSGVRQDLGMA